MRPFLRLRHRQQPINQPRQWVPTALRRQHLPSCPRRDRKRQRQQILLIRLPSPKRAQRRTPRNLPHALE